MWRKTLMIARYEARMSSRGWRFWLLLALLAGISLFARRDYLDRVSEGFFLHSAFSFQHPSFWLMLAILGLGASAIAMDICGRLRNSRMDKILFPLPVHPMEIMVGRFLGVLIIMIPLSLAGIFSLALWQYLYGNGAVIWAPFWNAFFLLILPLILPVAALSITLRTYFKHDFAALLAGCAVGAAIALVGVRQGVWINAPEVIQYLANSSPTLGACLSFKKYWLQLALHGILSVGVLSLAPLYLRRQEPQRWIVRRDSNKWIGFATLMRVITDFRVDRHLGWGYRISLAGILLFSTVSVLWASFRHQDYLGQNGAKEEEFQSRVKFPSCKVNVIRYEIALKPNDSYDCLEVEARMTFQPQESSKGLGVELDPRFMVDEALLGENPCSFLRQENRVRFTFPEELPQDREQTLTVRYHGAPNEFHPRYTALQSVWYPTPWRKIQKENEQWTQIDEDLFEASIALHLRAGQKGAFGGDLAEANESGGSRVEQWRTLYPVQSMQIFWGSYDSIEKEEFGYRMRFFHLPSHDYQALIYMEEVKDQQEFVHDKLGELPFQQLTLIETPYVWTPEEIPRKGVREPWVSPLAKPETFAEPMPGVLLIPENRLSYLHERMWLIERFDHDPRTIPFYQLLPSTLNEVHDQFYKNLISAYFDHSIHPTGEMAFWLKSLSSYAFKLLERDANLRRRGLDYDVGTNARLPLSVGRSQSLLTLHQSGEYPDLERIRGEALFRMIHHLLGDKTWWAFLRDMFKRYRFQEVPVENLLPLLQQYYGEDLSWYVKDWINGSVLPEYEITLAEAKIIEEERKSGVKYETSIQVKNHGTGRMSVPIYLETEMDYVTRDLWLDSGEEKTLILTVPHRPIYVMVDPEKWILQSPYLDPQKKVRSHSERRVVIEGQESTALRTNMRRNEERHFWRHH